MTNEERAVLLGITVVCVAMAVTAIALGRTPQALGED